MPRFVVLAVLAALASGCGDSSPTGTEPIAFDTVFKESVTGFSQTTRLVIHRESDWQQAWAQLHAGRSPVPALPRVDFGRETVVLAATGERSNGCYTIDLFASGLAGGSTAEVLATETVPGPACACLEYIAKPAHVIRLDRPSLGVAFVERQAERAC